MVDLLAMNIKYRAKIKKVYYYVKSFMVRFFLPKNYRHEFDFFNEICGNAYEDSRFLEMKIRSLAHQLDKTLVFTSVKKRVALRELILSKIEQLKTFKNYDITTVVWAEKVLEAHEERIAGRSLPKISLKKYGNESIDILDDIIKGRRSVRSFKEKDIDKGVLDRILEAGLWAPSGCNRQTIEYLVLDAEDDVRFCQRLAGEGHSFPREAPVCVVVLVDPRSYALPAQRHMAYLEGGATVQNMLLSAHSMGLGSCWLFWSKRSPEFYARFSLAPWLLPVAMICVGYADLLPVICPDRKQLKVNCKIPK